MSMREKSGWWGYFALGVLAWSVLVSGVPGLCGAGAARADDGGDHPLLYHGTAHDMLYAVSFDGNQGIAVGEYGLIVDSSDGGVTWTAQANPPTDLALLAVVRKAGHCIIGGQEGQVLISSDCKTWTLVQLSKDIRILDLALQSNGTAYAVGGFGTLLKSTDWGKSWQPLSMDWSLTNDDGDQPHLYRVHVADNGEVTVAGEYELIMVSDDGGAHWVIRHKGTRSLFGLAFAPDGTIYAVGQEGLILKSTDKGVTWTAEDPGTKTVLTSILVLPDGHLVASGIHTVLYSQDGGVSWQPDLTNRVRLGWDQDVGFGGMVSGHPSVVVVGSQATIASLER
jgi:photosystem II stability/assembly factor-like uncharacterized protein